MVWGRSCIAFGSRRCAFRGAGSILIVALGVVTPIKRADADLQAEHTRSENSASVRDTDNEALYYAARDVCYPDIDKKVLSEFAAKVVARLDAIKDLPPSQYAARSVDIIDELTRSQSKPNLKKALVAYLLQKQVDQKQAQIQRLLDSVQKDTAIKQAINAYAQSIQDWHDVAKASSAGMFSSAAQINAYGAQLLNSGLTVEMAQDITAKKKLLFNNATRNFFAAHAQEFGITNHDQLIAIKNLVVSSLDSKVSLAFDQQISNYDSSIHNAQLGSTVAGLTLGSSLAAIGGIIAGPGGAAIAGSLGLTGSATAAATLSLTGAGFGLAFGAGTETVKTLVHGGIAIAHGKSFVCELADHYTNDGMKDLLIASGVGAGMGLVLGPLASAYKSAAITSTVALTAWGAYGIGRAAIDAHNCQNQISDLQTKLQAHDREARDNGNYAASAAVMNLIREQSEACFKKWSDAGIDLASLGVGIPAAIKTFKVGNANYEGNRQMLGEALESLKNMFKKISLSSPAPATATASSSPVTSPAPNAGTSEVDQLRSSVEARIDAGASRINDRPDLIAAFNNLKNRELSEAELLAIEKAHNAGDTQREGPYTSAELQEKVRILKAAGFSPIEREAMMRSGVTGLENRTGFPARSSPYLYDKKPVAVGTQIKINVGAGDNTVATVIALNDEHATMQWIGPDGKKQNGSVDLSKFLNRAAPLYYYKNKPIAAGTELNIQAPEGKKLARVVSLNGTIAVVEWNGRTGRQQAPIDLATMGLPTRPTSVGASVGGGAYPAAILTQQGESPHTFNGVPLDQITSPNGAKIKRKFFTAQGSEYILAEDGQTRRIKSRHGNTQDDDSGLHAWMDRGTFLRGERASIFGKAVGTVFNNFHGSIRLTTQYGKVTMEGFENGQWRALRWKEVFSTTFTNWNSKVAPVGANDVVATDFSESPALGDQLLEMVYRPDGSIRSFHPGSPVSFVETL